ncbi:Tetracycline resistance protein [Methanosarcina barkeri str. Wiesmoor]|uniref:Tetracycline resistance protein n=2 Tax=Methanosarcina barkeri TaxID=2208 RepID=A0A0E3QJ45_METBA|nr:MFS transporter [Methanosarcina barkeri]AKB49442.1 Tetracycline resistance protein [Methanosarcina barkeri str. Wiesmoor]
MEKENKGKKNNPDLHTGENVSLLPILAVNFIGTLGFSIVLPFLVFLVNRLGGNAFIYGLASSMYPAFQLIGAPILGRWSDTYGRKKILFISQLGTLFSWIIFLVALFLPVISLFKIDSRVLGAFTVTLPLAVLFFARALDGLTGGNVSVANAYLADITAERDRSRNFGKMAISENLGFIVGPALAGILSLTMYGDVAPVLGAIVISLIGTLLIISYLPESKKCAPGEPEEAEYVRKIFGYEIKECKTTFGTKKPEFREILRLQNIPYMLGLYFLIDLGYNVFYTAFPLHAISTLNWSIAKMGVYFTVLSGFLIIVQSTVLPRASRKYSDATLIIFGSLMLGTNFLLLIPGNILLTYLAAGFFALGDGLMWPSFLSLLSKVAGRKYQGTIQGVASSFGGLASITGLILGGLLYETLSGASFLIAGLVIYTVFLLNFRLRHFEEQIILKNK